MHTPTLGICAGHSPAASDTGEQLAFTASRRVVEVSADCLAVTLSWDRDDNHDRRHAPITTLKPPR